MSGDSMIERHKADKDCALTKPALENVDPLTARVFHALGRVMHLNRLVMARAMGQYGVQFPEVIALTLLTHNDGISQRELAEALHLSHPRVSTILNALEKSGAVERHPDETDRRSVRVVLTEEGRRREKLHRSVMGAYVGRTIGELSEADKLELERLLNELGDRIKALLQDEREARPAAEDGRGR
jgi:MarR family transcriptional regulator, organic hydroperoxide resistance regulator